MKGIHKNVAIQYIWLDTVNHAILKGIHKPYASAEARIVIVNGTILKGSYKINIKIIMKVKWYIVYMIWCIFISCLLEATDVVYDSPIYQKFILVDKNETEVLFKNELGTFKYHSSSENDRYFNTFKKINIGQRFNTTKQYIHPTLYELAIDNETKNNIANYYDIFLGKLALSWLGTLLTLGFGACGTLCSFMFLMNGHEPSIIIFMHSLCTLVLGIAAIN